MAAERRSQSAHPATAAKSRKQPLKSVAHGPSMPQYVAGSPEPASAAEILSLQRTHGNRAVQQLLARRVQRRSFHPAEGGEIGVGLSQSIERARGGRQALDEGLSEQMGSAKQADFGGVRLHTDARADRLNRSLSVQVFTVGSDIFFQQGAYHSGSSSGRQLLAHDLTHVVQHGRAKIDIMGTGRGGYVALNDVFDRQGQPKAPG